MIQHLLTDLLTLRQVGAAKELTNMQEKVLTNSMTGANICTIIGANLFCGLNFVQTPPFQTLLPPVA
jgi:hypothetical protein